MASMNDDYRPHPELIAARKIYAKAGRHDARPAITALANAYTPEENR